MTPPPDGAARRFHELTSYATDRHWLVPADDPAIRQDFLPLMEDQRPPAAKAYPAGLPRVELPAGAAVAPAGLPGGAGLDRLSWLLHWSAGVVRVRTGRSGRQSWYRAAGSAGNLHPVEVYVQASGISGLPDGVWHYDPAGHALTRVGPPAAGGVTLILTGVPWRSEWKYAERGYRHVWWDAGSIIAHLELLTAALGRPASIRLGFPDAEVAALVGADGQRELPLALIDLGRVTSAWAPAAPAAPAAPGDLGPPGPDFPLVTAAHEAGSHKDWDAAGAILDLAGSGDDAMDPARATALVRRRAVTRSFRRAPLAAATVGALAGAAGRPVRWDAGEVPAAFRVLVHADVTELSPGCYEAKDGALEPVSLGDLRAAGQASCLDQPSAADCAFLMLLVGHLDEQLARHGERGYRALQLFAGIAAGRAQLAAVAAGLGCAPLTVHDEAARAMLPPGTVPLIAVAAGRPASVPPEAGLPGAPARLGKAAQP